MRQRCAVLAALLCLATVTTAQPVSSFLHKKLADWRRDLESSPRPEVRRSAAFALGRMGGLAAFALDDLDRVLRKDRDPGVREMAACAIGDIVLSIDSYSPTREWEVVGQTLQEALANEPNPRIRRSVAYAVGAFGPLAVPAERAVRNALADANPLVRSNAAWALGRMANDAAAISDLCARLEDQSVLVRRDAALALGQMGQPGRKVPRANVRAAAVPLLKHIASESDESVRKVALGAVTTLVDETHRPLAGPLYPLLGSKDVETSRAAAYALGNMGGEPARRALDVLRQALADPAPEVQGMASAVLASAGRDAAGAIPDLARLLTQTKHLEVRRNIAIALGTIGESANNAPVDPAILDSLAAEAVPALAETLKPVADITDLASQRLHEEVRDKAAEALLRIRFRSNVRAMPMIRQVIEKDANHQLRHRCIETLFHCRPSDLDTLGMTPLLTAALEEAGPERRMVRYDAARVLAIVKEDQAPDRTSEVLLEMMEGKGLRVFFGSGAAIQGVPGEGRSGGSRATESTGGDARFLAAQALGWMGKKARNNKAVVDALEKASDDPDPMLRKHARQALKQIGARD